MATAQDIQGFYGLLGRAPDQAGLDYWTQQANNGMSMDAIRQSFQNVAIAGTDPLKPQGLMAPQANTPPVNNPGGFLVPSAGSAGDIALRGGQSVGGMTYNPTTNSASYNQPPPQGLLAPQAPASNPVSIAQSTPYYGVYGRGEAPGDANYASNPTYQGLLAQTNLIDDEIRGNGLTASQMPELMARRNALQAQMTYGTAPTGVKPDISAALASIYQNSLGRQVDQAGRDYWTNEFTSGRQTLQQIEENIGRNEEAKNKGFSLYMDSPMFAGNEYTPEALAGRGLAQQGLSYLPSAPAPSAPPPKPGMGGNNPPPGPLPWRAPQGLLATQPPVPGQYNQGMTGAPAGSFTRPAPNYWNGNDFVIPHFQTPASRPTTPLLPTGISDGNASAAGAAGNESTGSTGGLIAGAALPAVAGLVGVAGDALINGLSAFPAGAALISKLGMTPADVAGMELSAAGKLVPIAGTAAGTSRSAAFAQNFNAALKPGWMNTLSAGLAALPDLLEGDYGQGIGAGLGTYAGAAAGTALGAGLGGVLGNFVIPGVGGVAGGLLGKQLGGVFGPGKSVGPNAGANLAVNNGMAQFQSSGADNKGNTQYVDQFINAVAMGANEAAKNNGVKLSDGGYRIAVEVIKGKLNVVGADGVKRSFEPDQGKEAYQYAVESLLKSGKT